MSDDNITNGSCTPQERIPTIYWNSKQCCTLECPPDFAGSSVTVCIEANSISSTISQEDANSQAMAEACRQATGQLICLPPQVNDEEKTLLLSLSGAYSLDFLSEEENLNLSLFGDYVLQPIGEEQDLLLSLAGDYVLVPFDEAQSLGLAISPLSEYRIIPFDDLPNLQLSLIGTYALVISPTANSQESLPLGLSLQGDYVNVIVQTDSTARANLGLGTTGDYVLRIVDGGLSAHTMPVALSLIGAYTLTIQPVNANDATGLGIGVLGSYS